METDLSRKFVLSLMYLLAASLGLAAGARAQTPGSTPAPLVPAVTPPGGATSSGKPPAAADKDILSQVALDLIYLPGPDGNLVPVPAGASLQEYLTWLQKKQQPEASPAPAAQITSLALQGTTEEDRALLTARIKVQVLKSNEWVQIPLDLDEAVLKTATATGPGENVAGRQEDGAACSWWFRGSGLHELTLELIVPVRKQQARRRLQLSLPNAAVSSVKLTVPYPDVQPRIGERSTLSVRTRGNNSEIEAFGLGNELDLTWQPAPQADKSETLLEASTAITVHLVEGEALSLEVLQKLQALQGKFSEFHTQLPPGMELVGIDGSDFLEQQADPQHPGRLLIRLKRATSGPVELHWTLRAAVPAPNVPLTISGFQVPQARVQTGFILLQLTGDFQVSRQSEEERHVRRINPAELPQTLRSTPATVAYRFLTQPFRLVFQLLKIEPFVTVEPVMHLSLGTNRAELAADYSFFVSRGSISTIELSWPRQAAENWTLDGLEPLELIERSENLPNGNIRVQLVGPIRESFQMRLRAHREIPREPVSFPVSFPMSRVSNAAATVVETYLADDVEAQFAAVPGTVLRTLPGGLGKVAPPREMQSLRKGAYRIESGPPHFTAALTRHTRQIAADTEVQATVSQGHLLIRQRLTYEVLHDRLSQLLLRLPPALRADQVQVFTWGGVPLEAAALDAAEVAAGGAAYIVDPPRTGRFEFDIRYRLPVTPRPPGAQGIAAPHQQRIPLVLPRDLPYRSVRLVWNDANHPEAIVAGDGWTRQAAADGQPAWGRSGDAREIVVTLPLPSGNVTRGIVVSHGLLRSVWEQGKHVQTRAQYRVSSRSGALLLAFPPAATPSAFYWNRQQVFPNRIGSAGDGTALFELTIPERKGAKEPLLTVDYFTLLGAPTSLASPLQIPAPEFGSNVWVNSILWELRLPASEHLFQRPSGFVPEYRWERTNSVYARIPHLHSTDLDEWIGEGDGPEGIYSGPGFNVYLFGASGPLSDLSLLTMSQPVIVLMGAGLALAVGFILVRIPRTRHMTSLLAVMLLVAVVGVWFPEPVLLLAQPAAIGLLLAVVAAWLETRLARRRNARIVTIAPQSSYLSGRPDVTPISDLLVNVGSEDFTISGAEGEPPAPRESRPLPSERQL